VAQGQRRGRAMGFPTLNLILHRTVAPVRGIFAAVVHGLDGGAHPGVAYVGDRPIIEDRTLVLEVHLFDFDRECYGAHVRVDLISKIRDDMRFVSFDELRDQIAVDAKRAKAILAGA
jgi:riboflavin kinase / FMN adenylyltransferase